MKILIKQIYNNIVKAFKKKQNSLHKKNLLRQDKYYKK